jgi:tetratricopeptide (TPR) repeat protein
MSSTENSVMGGERETPKTEPMEEEKTHENKEEEPKNEDGEVVSSSSSSVSSTASDDSDTDSPPAKDPEVLLIKATTLKDEGNNHFKEKDYEKASRSYRRGTNALKPLNKGNTGDEQVKALLISLQTNLSMMCFKLNKNKQSVQLATAVLKIDDKNVKARYRRAVANRKLGEPEKARNDLREAYKIDPSNPAVKKELASLKKEMDTQKKAQRKSMQKAFGGGLLYDDKEAEQKRKQEQEALKKKHTEEALKKRKAEWEDECVKRMAKGEEAISFEDYEKVIKEEEDTKNKEEEEQRKKEEKARKVARKKAREATKKEESDDEDELTERELAQLRGYKKTSDGRTTSYFTREQSLEEKQLAAVQNAPKRLESAPSAGNGSIPLIPESSGAKGNASAWNQAGTWEEKDTTEWCRERLTKRLQESTVESTGTLMGVVTKVENMTGDASVAVVSEKKRYIFDFHGKVVFDIRDQDTEDVIATGSFQLPDICSTHHEELDVIIEAWKKAPTENAILANECRDSLVSEVRESVKLWVSDFNQRY